MAGAVWLAEGFVFGSFFRFSSSQTVAMAVIYIALFAAACVAFVRRAERYSREGDSDLPLWRYVSLAPQITVVVGSFLSLPLLMLVLALGRVV